nr:metallopeptidase TldD-related protein [Micromonospora sp. DSM 115978]
MTSHIDLAGRVVDLVRRVAGPDAQAEVCATHLALALTRFANSYIHQNVAEATTTVRLKLHVDGRSAAGSTTLTDGDALRALVERTVAAARLGPPDPRWPGLTPPEPAPAAGRWDEATAQASPAERAERIRAFVEAAEGLETAGYCRTAYHSGAFANTAGQAVHGESAEAVMDGIARVDGVDGVARVAADRLADLDGAILGHRAAVKARAGAAPVEVPSRPYEVVLEPTAVADLIGNLAMYGFNGKAFNERRSFVQPGVAQFDPSVSLVDAPTAVPFLPFDVEGTPRRRVPLVEAGMSRAVAHDRRTAAAAGTVSTGHGSPASPTWGPVPMAVALTPSDPVGGPGDAGRAAEVAGPIADSDTAALVAQVRHGLLVTDLWYTRVLDPRSLVVTGLTRNGVWLIEDGEVTTAVRNLRFTQSYPQALAPGSVLGIGRFPVRQPDGWLGARWTAPALRLASWNFTGGASG